MALLVHVPADGAVAQPEAWLAAAPSVVQPRVRSLAYPLNVEGDAARPIAG